MSGTELNQNYFGEVGWKGQDSDRKVLTWSSNTNSGAMTFP